MSGIPPEYQAEVDRIVARALREQGESFALDGLKAELKKVWQAIAEANHFKRDFGRQFEELNTLVRGHVALAMHPGTAEAFTVLDNRMQHAMKEFNLEELTPEQRQAFPVVVQSVLDERQRQSKAIRRGNEFWQRIAYYSAATTVAVSVASATGLFAWFREVVFHVPALKGG
jgi:hypothetical protein